VQITREASSANVIRAWEQGRILVGQDWIDGHLIVSADRVVRDWALADPARIAVTDLAAAIELGPEIIVLGTGFEPPFPDTELMAALAAQSIGLEIMTTPAACRTYNVLLHEQRRVAAALCIET
jgi:uncharacterized protein